MRLGMIALCTAMIAAGSIATGVPAAAAPVPSSTQPGYTIADPNCDVGSGTPFVPLTDQNGTAISRVFTGIANGSAYRIEVPTHWNHELVLWAHGFRGTGTTVFVDNSP